jgi:hypothetical protein
MLNFFRWLLKLDRESSRVVRARSRWVRANRPSWTAADDRR